MITKCRICGSKDLRPILDLGEMALTGVFQKDGRRVKRAPLALVLCMGSCGLLQLKDAVARSSVFGPSYGYASGINATMRDHLLHVAATASRRVELAAGEVVLDIGSNDGTLLNCYPPQRLRVGIDPSGRKWKKNYGDKTLIVGYFPRDRYPRRAKIVTSVACLYDLDKPLDFFRGIKRQLAPDGIWVTEQSYMPTMLRRCAYDTICHEHIEYYGLTQIKWMADRVGLKIIDASENDINGGSFCVTLAHQDSELKRNDKAIEDMLREEAHLRMIDLWMFVERVAEHRAAMRGWINSMKNKLVLGYGASTKGNVILQYCGIRLKCIADRNPAKWGLRTPGTNIPIASEEYARSLNPDYFLVLPWHFRKEIEAREKAFTDKGGKLFFPLGVE